MFFDKTDKRINLNLSNKTDILYLLPLTQNQLNKIEENQKVTKPGHQESRSSICSNSIYTVFCWDPSKTNSCGGQTDANGSTNFLNAENDA